MSNLGCRNQLGGARLLLLKHHSNEMRHLKRQGKIWPKTYWAVTNCSPCLYNLSLTELPNFLGRETLQCLPMNSHILYLQNYSTPQASLSQQLGSSHWRHNIHLQMLLFRPCSKSYSVLKMQDQSFTCSQTYLGNMSLFRICVSSGHCSYITLDST